MKKRILALALAGTTAFSVFGAAASAAWSTDSVHNSLGYDKYVKYEAPDAITVTAGTTTGTTPIYSYTAPNGKTTYTAAATVADITISDGSYYALPSAPTVFYAWAELNAAGYSASEVIGTNGKQIVPSEEVVDLTSKDGATTKHNVPTFVVAADGLTVSAVKDANGTQVTGAIVATGDYWTNNGYVANGSATGSFTSTPAITKGWNMTLTGIMDIPVVAGTAYLYDYYYANDELYTKNYYALAGAAANEAALATIVGNGATLAKEQSYSVYVGERVEVIAAWEAFMSEMGINPADPYIEEENEFVSNYMNMLYNDPYYSPETGEYLGYVKVDLYNIEGLLDDIWAMRFAYKTANTSEIIYLMQQYDKYVGEYFDLMDVETSEWGELMLSILESAAEEDFGLPVSYRNYTRQVEELRYAYETATTLAQIQKAEVGMYNLLTKSTYGAAKTPASTAALNATMAGLFFNEKAAPAIYNADAAKPAIAKGVYAYTGNVWEMYPAEDYADVTFTNTADAFNGNEGPYAGYVTAEYEWFLNVYELAANMKAASKKYQGSIDAVNDALVAAVEALEVTSTPYATEVSALEEMAEEYEGLIDTDYNAYFYGPYAEAYAFAEVAEGKQQIRNARLMIEEAGKSLANQGTQLTIKKNDINDLKAAIKEANAALNAIKNSDEYNAAQVSALNKAIDGAEAIVEVYEGTAGKTKASQSVDGNYTAVVGDKDQIVLSDLAAAEEAIEAAINYATVIEGWSKTEDGAWQYGEGGEYFQDGWKKIGSSWYLFEEGTAVESDWRKIDGKWYYLNKNCAAAYGWCKVDGEWYYFDGDCSMAEGWRKVDGNWYYLTPNEVGKMVTGEQIIDGVKYNFSTESNSLGQML